MAKNQSCTKKKSNRGRKQFDGKDKKDVIGKLEKAWAVGASDAQAALLADIHPDVLCRYLKKHPEIVQRKEALLNTPKLTAKITLVNAINTDAELALKYLERTEPKHFAPLQRQATTDSEGNDLNPHFDKDESKL